MTTIRCVEEHRVGIPTPHLTWNPGHTYVRLESAPLPSAGLSRQALSRVGRRLVSPKRSMTAQPGNSFALDRNTPKWEHHKYPYAGRPAVHRESLLARSIAQAERFSAVSGWT